MDDAEQERLADLIAASDEVVAATGGSADPVAQREVFEALARKARALGTLGRYDARVAVWDEMVRIFKDEPPAGRPLIVLQATAAKAADLLLSDRLAEAVEAANTVLDIGETQDRGDAVRRLTARSLVIKRDALVRMGRDDDALRANEQITGRFFDAEDPELRGQVNRALSFESRAMWRADRVDDAIEVSQRIVGRFVSEAETSLRESGATVINDLTRLMRIGGPDLRGIAWTALVAASNSVYEAMRRTAARLPAIRPTAAVSPGPFRSAVGAVGSLVRAEVPPRLTHSRRRLAQALAGSEVVIARLDGSDDPDLQEMAATARIIHGIALCGLGHPVAGMRALDQVSSGHQPGGVQAWQMLAAGLARGDQTLDTVGAVSALGLRAQALGAGDRGIAQIAYDDSLHDHGVTGRSAIVDLIARALKPTNKRRSSR